MPEIEELISDGTPVAPPTTDADKKTKHAIDAKAATRILFGCATAGDAEALRKLFDECVLIDHTARELDDCQPIPADLRREEDGSTALLVACESGFRECAELLLAHGCPPGRANPVSYTHLTLPTTPYV